MHIWIGEDKRGMLIGICDDEQNIHVTVDKYLEHYKEKRKCTCQIKHYYSGFELLKANDELDCLLLDIELGGVDGIDVAKRLRTQGQNYKIIMLTVREDRYKEAFVIGAFRFVSKPIDGKELIQSIDAVRRSLRGLDYTAVYRDNYLYEIKQKDIIYIMANRSETIIYTQNCEFRSEKSLSIWEKELDAELFFRCHRSYVVNMSYVDYIKGRRAVLKSGECVAISKRSISAFKSNFRTNDVNYG